MSALRLHLFGAPRLERDEKAVKIDTQKAMALLVYLILNDQECSREALATLFWPEQGAPQARTSLRRALWTLRRAVGEAALTGDKHTVRFHVPPDMSVDLLEFQALIAAAHTASHTTEEQMDDLRAAIALYRSDFLAGFSLPDSPLFDEWQFFTADRLRRNLADALQQLIEWEISQQEFVAAGELARRWLALDPLHEPAHRRLMQIYAWSGQQSAALRQYEECNRILTHELGVPPEAETTQLYTAIRDRQLDLSNQPGSAKTERRAAEIWPEPPRSNLPARKTHLLGREMELAEIDLLMVDQGERLVTITGTGGMGKTSLALAAAERQRKAGRFRDGIFFVPLATVDAVQAILPALVNALELSSDASQTTASALKRRLLDYLGPRQMLLIFDNFEHLLEGRELLTEILVAAPDVQLLVTSRERLRLYDEQLYPIGGLQCPTTSAESDAPALALFLRSARRVQPSFQPGSVDLAHLVRICHLVSGMPLALELAASWVGLLSPSALAAALQTNLDLLETSLYDTPARHRTMRAAFDTTWTLLGEKDRQGFAQLSVFRGGFTRESAAQVAGVTFKDLRSLVDKSLVESHPTTDRFEVHELLRQYGTEKLGAHAAYAETSARHLRYFLHLAEQAEPHLRGADRMPWIRSLADEHHNLRLAFDWACTAGMGESALRLAVALIHYWLGHGDWEEGARSIARGLALGSGEGDADTCLRARLLYGAGLFAWNQSDYMGTQAYTEESLRLFQTLADESGSAQTLHLLGLTARAQRNFAQAVNLFEQSLTLARKLGNRLLAATVLADMGAIAWRQSDFIRANQLYEESLTYHQLEGNAHGVALNLYSLGLVACWQGKLEQARLFGERSLAAFQQHADPFYVAQALGLLAIVATYENKLEQAQTLLSQTLERYQTLGAQRSIAITLLRLGHVERRQGNWVAAGQYYGQATPLLRRIGDPLNLIYAVEGWLYLAVEQSQFVTAARLGGTVAAWRERLGIIRPPVETSEYDHYAAAIRTALDESDLRLAWAEGGKHSLDQALEWGLSTHVL
jgi:predicted ATPase/DNA-binding SARP family transcriptional activator